jgi:hypothetical protein
MRSNSHGGRQVNQIVPTTREDRLPALHVREVDRDLHAVVMFWEGGGVGTGTPVLRRPFNADEQSLLDHRTWELRCAVAPFQDRNRDELLQAISMMLGFPNMQRLDRSAALSMAVAYLSLTKERPHWAIVKACLMVRLGTAGLNPAYCPSEPEFNILIGRLVDPYVDALRRTECLMVAKIAPPSPPKPTRAEIEAKLGHPLSTPSSEAKAAPVPAGDGKHAVRVMAELAARKVRKEMQQAELAGQTGS